MHSVQCEQQGWAPQVKNFCDNRRWQSTTITRQPGTNNNHSQRYQKINGQHSTTDNRQSTTNNYHRQIHPTNKINTLQQMASTNCHFRKKWQQSPYSLFSGKIFNYDFSFHWSQSWIRQRNDINTITFIISFKLGNDKPTMTLLSTNDWQRPSINSLSNMSNGRRFCPSLMYKYMYF
jgi:hypothetical protein